jgi:hypothetical protein
MNAALRKSLFKAAEFFIYDFYKYSLIIFLIIINFEALAENLSGYNFFNQIFINNNVVADSNYFYTDYQLFSNYYYSNSSGEKKYWYNSKAEFGSSFLYDKYKFGIKYTKAYNDLYYKDISKSVEKINLYRIRHTLDLDVDYIYNNHLTVGSGLIISDRQGFKWGMKYDSGRWKSEFEGNIHYDGWQTDYIVDYNTDNFIFSYYALESKIKIRYSFLQCEFKYQKTFTADSERDITNSIDGDIYNLNTDLEISKYKFNAQAGYGFINAVMRFKGTEFARLDHLGFWKLKSEIEYQYNKNNYFAVGIDFWETYIGNNSYFDIWPFTYWDVVLASRTRLKQFENEFYLPYVNYNSVFKFSIFNLNQKLNSQITYQQIISNSDIVYKERYYVLYPLLTGYKTHYMPFNQEIDGIFLLGFNWILNIRTNLKLNLQSSQLIPINWSELFDIKEGVDINSSESTSRKIKEWGGNYLKGELVYYFNSHG